MIESGLAGGKPPVGDVRFATSRPGTTPSVHPAVAPKATAPMLPRTTPRVPGVQVQTPICSRSASLRSTKSANAPPGLWITAYWK